MKKKIIIILALILSITATILPTVAYANMMPPKEAGIASNITFEKNDDISVTKEVLDIVVKGSLAEITAMYYMKNTSNKDIAISSMFLSPNIENEKNVSVTANNVSLDFIAKTYTVGNGSEKFKEEDGKIIVVEPEIFSEFGNNVDTIEFEIPFSSKGEVVVLVKYMYTLGGYYGNYGNRGEIEYYLTIASYWKDFSDLTINLTLDESMPVLKSSNLEFVKMDEYSYQYKSDSLPKENLKIKIDETPWQKFVGDLKSPYTLILVIPLLCLILIIAGIVITCVLIVRSVKKKKARNGKDTIDKKN